MRTTVTISYGTSRKSTDWRRKDLTIAELYQRLRTPMRSVECMEEYLTMPKSQQDELKDVGGFIGGTLAGSRRLVQDVTGRDLVTLDFDTIPPYGTDGVIASVKALGVSFCIYSTRKHRAKAPRLRIVLPLTRTVTADEYEPIARRLAEKVGMGMADPTTFEPNRLMYWPSVCADGEFVYEAVQPGFAPLADADAILRSYADWRDMRSWPQIPGEPAKYARLAARQGDPDGKPGLVGAFNRAYGTCLNAADALLPGVYKPVDNDPHRLTYAGGSTTGGAVLYDGDRFLYSHHATDPCSGRLVNAFDLVRLHKFGGEDADVAPGTPVNRTPSYEAMCSFVLADRKVQTLLAQERRQSVADDFAEVLRKENIDPVGVDPDSMDWVSRLDASPKTGLIKPTIDNCIIILENDPLLKGRFALNRFANRGELLGKVPWSADEGRRLWSDTDSDGLYWYMEKAYTITNRGAIDAALNIHSAAHAFNEVQDYLNGLKWDGVKRLDTMLVDYLGAEDSAYTRAVTRKAFTAAVARALHPGCKYDTMLILCGPQGIGKSTLLDRMSRGWFNDSIRTFEGKEASELLPGVWLVEVAELDAFRKSDVSRIKQFLSLRADRYRAAYGKHVKELPRCCVFFGTCNELTFLQDTTGNRRFWPVDVGLERPTRSVWEDMTPAEVDQLWAEARTRYQLGEELHLRGAIEQTAREIQEAHRDASPREGMVAEFVERDVPADWARWDIQRRRDYWAGLAPVDADGLSKRDRVCAVEVWTELFGNSPGSMKVSDAKEINAILARLPGFDSRATVQKFGPYACQRGFRRC